MVKCLRKTIESNAPKKNSTFFEKQKETKMKEEITDTCIEYMKLKANSKNKEARKLLENLDSRDFITLYLAGLDYLKETLDDPSSPYILVQMARQYFTDNVEDFNDLAPNDLSCHVVDGFIFSLMEKLQKSKSSHIAKNPFAQELLNDSDPEVAAVGKEILEGRF